MKVFKSQKGLSAPVCAGRQAGFTLIELLIVIVIIGILAGVLIAVINPTSQQNKARDAGTTAAINKVALASEGYISAYGAAPNDAQFIGGLAATVADSGTSCASSTDYVCNFTVTGNILPATCAASGWTGTGTTQCVYHYDGDVSGNGALTNDFSVSAKSAGIVDTVFVYRNYGGGAGQVQKCTNADPPVCSVN